MSSVTTKIGKTEVTVLAGEILDCMEFFCCSYEDAVFFAGCQALGLTGQEIVALTEKRA